MPCILTTSREGLISDKSDVSSTGRRRRGQEKKNTPKNNKNLSTLFASQQENQEETKCSWSASCRPQISATLFSAVTEKVFNFQPAQNAAGLSLVLGEK